MRITLPALVVVSLVLVGAPRAAAQDLTYAAFALLPDEARLHAFLDATPENRADLIRTHLQRWLDEHRPRLSADQIAQAEENLAFISPDLYRPDPDPAVAAHALDLAIRSRALFPAEDLARALWGTGDGWTRITTTPPE